MTSLQWISSTITTYGYVALFLATIVEGPIATVIGAFLASQGLLEVALVYVVAVSGDLVGDLLFYAVGRAGKIPRQLVGMRQRRRLALLQEVFHAHPGKALLLGKLTHAAGFLVLLAAGVTRVGIAPFLGFNLLGTLPKTGLFVLIGYFAGAAYRRIDTYLWLVSCALFLVIFLGIAMYVRRRVTVDPEA